MPGQGKNRYAVRTLTPLTTTATFISMGLYGCSTTMVETVSSGVVGRVNTVVTFVMVFVLLVVMGSGPVWGMFGGVYVGIEVVGLLGVHPNWLAAFGFAGLAVGMVPLLVLIRIMESG